MKPFVTSAKLHHDERGYFTELYHAQDHEFLGRVDQVNLSFSERNVVRGMHFQAQNPQAKLIRVINGLVSAAVIDVRVDSSSFGHVYKFLDLGPGSELFVPKGFANGFWAKQASYYLYVVSGPRVLGDEMVISPRTEGLPWSGTQGLILSRRDQTGMTLDKYKKLVLRNREEAQ